MDFVKRIYQGCILNVAMGGQQVVRGRDIGMCGMDFPSYVLVFKISDGFGSHAFKIHGFGSIFHSERSDCHGTGSELASEQFNNCYSI